MLDVIKRSSDFNVVVPEVKCTYHFVQMSTCKSRDSRTTDYFQSEAIVWSKDYKVPGRRFKTGGLANAF